MSDSKFQKDAERVTKEQGRGGPGRVALLQILMHAETVNEVASRLRYHTKPTAKNLAYALKSLKIPAPNNGKWTASLTKDTFNLLD